MIILELKEVEVDHCLSCGGIWLDEGELELLLSDTSEKDKLIASFQLAEETGEKRKKCPVCRKKMDKVHCGLAEKVLIDKCQRNHGLWFDKGELDETLKIGCIEDSEVLGLLKNIFNQNQ
jgi:Zn-finger nucleic acid-binding protein